MQTQAPGDVLFVDDDQDLRESVVEVVRASFGRECVSAAGYRELVALGERIHRCDIAILDINLGGGSGSGIDAYTWLRERGFRGRIVFLTGHAVSHPLVVGASQIGDARVIAKPISFEDLAELIRGAPLEQTPAPYP